MCVDVCVSINKSVIEFPSEWFRSDQFCTHPRLGGNGGRQPMLPPEGNNFVLFYLRQDSSPLPLEGCLGSSNFCSIKPVTSRFQACPPACSTEKRLFTLCFWAEAITENKKEISWGKKMKNKKYALLVLVTTSAPHTHAHKSGIPSISYYRVHFVPPCFLTASRDGTKTRKVRSSVLTEGHNCSSGYTRAQIPSRVSFIVVLSVRYPYLVTCARSVSCWTIPRSPRPITITKTASQH